MVQDAPRLNVLTDDGRQAEALRDDLAVLMLRVVQRIGPGPAAVWLWLWMEAGYRSRRIVVTTASVAAVNGVTRAGASKQLQKLAEARFVTIVDAIAHKAGGTELIIENPAGALEPGPQAVRGDAQRPLFDDDDPATVNSEGISVDGSSGRAPIRARANERNDWNEERALRFSETDRSVSPPRAYSHSTHSEPRTVNSPPSPVAGLSKDRRIELGFQVLDAAGSIHLKLGSPPGLYRWVSIVAAYLREVSGASSADVEGIIFAAVNPGDAVQTRDAGRLFAGGLQALIRRRRESLIKLPLFAGSALHDSTWADRRKAVLPRLRALREALAELEVSWNPSWDGRPQSPRAP